LTILGDDRKATIKAYLEGLKKAGVKVEVVIGYIEGKNTLSKILKRLSFGFRNRNHFIKKIFLGCCPQNLIPQLLT
jgi:transposase